MHTPYALEAPTSTVFTNLNTLGWVLIILGAIQLAGGFSLIAGNAYGRLRANRLVSTVVCTRCDAACPRP